VLCPQHSIDTERSGFCWRCVQAERDPPLTGYASFWWRSRLPLRDPRASKPPASVSLPVIRRALYVLDRKQEAEYTRGQRCRLAVARP
jgi:hypothetical protein